MDIKPIQTIKKRFNTQIFVCNTSFWEIFIKCNLGKLDLNGVSSKQLSDIAPKMDIDVLQINHDIVVNFYQLPNVENHKNPFEKNYDLLLSLSSINFGFY